MKKTTKYEYDISPHQSDECTAETVSLIRRMALMIERAHLAGVDVTVSLDHRIIVEITEVDIP